MTDKPRLLIADDSELVRKEMFTILEDEFELVEAENGEQAWAMISSDKDIKVIFADLTMPTSDGLTLLKRIRSDDDKTVSALPVVMMTEATDDLSSVKDSLASGVTDLVRKPFIPELLKARATANVRPRDENQHPITATVDPLTQLANEPYFMLRGANNLSYAMRHNEGFGVLLVRLDKFTELSRLYEAYVVESLQVKIGSYISSVVRAEDTVARLDEGTFGVLLVGVDPAGMLYSAERIQQRVKKKVVRYYDERFSVTVSIGAAAPILKPQTSFEMILRQARSELQKALAGGGDRVEADSIYQRLSGKSDDSKYIPGLDEALEMLNNNQGKLLEGCTEELFSKLLPLLVYCDKRMKLELVDQIQEIIRSKSGKTTP